MASLYSSMRCTPHSQAKLHTMTGSCRSITYSSLRFPWLLWECLTRMSPPNYVSRYAFKLTSFAITISWKFSFLINKDYMVVLFSWNISFVYFSVSITISRRCAKLTIQLEKNNWLDNQWCFKFCYYILLLYSRPGASSIPKRWWSCWFGSSWYHNVHLCCVGGELPNGIIYKLLHIHTTYIHMGKHWNMVYLPYGIWSNRPFNLNHCI